MSSDKLSDRRAAELNKKNLTRANLARQNLIGVNLTRANLREAVLIEVKFYNANLTDAKLSRAKLMGPISPKPIPKGRISATPISIWSKTSLSSKSGRPGLMKPLSFPSIFRTGRNKTAG